MQIKTTMRFDLTQVKMADIKKSTKIKCWRRCGEKGTLLHSWWKCKLIQSIYNMENILYIRRTIQRFFKKLKIELLMTMQSNPKNIHGEKHDLKAYMHPNVHCSIIYNRTWKQTKCPLTEEWIKMWDICKMNP